MVPDRGRAPTARLGPDIQRCQPPWLRQSRCGSRFTPACCMHRRLAWDPPIAASSETWDVRGPTTPPTASPGPQPPRALRHAAPLPPRSFRGASPPRPAAATQRRNPATPHLLEHGHQHTTRIHARARRAPISPWIHLDQIQPHHPTPAHHRPHQIRRLLGPQPTRHRRARARRRRGIEHVDIHRHVAGQVSRQMPQQQPPALAVPHVARPQHLDRLGKPQFVVDRIAAARRQLLLCSTSVVDAGHLGVVPGRPGPRNLSTKGCQRGGVSRSVRRTRRSLAARRARRRLGQSRRETAGCFPWKKPCQVPRR